MTFDFYLGVIIALLVLCLLAFLCGGFLIPWGRTKRFLYDSEEDGSFQMDLKVRPKDPNGLWWRLMRKLFNYQAKP